MDISVLDALVMAAVGLGAGVLAGMLGIGGSIIMIPAMTLVFHGRAWDNQHMFQAAAMVVNVAVAAPATIRHHRARAMQWDVVKILVPATLVAMVAGVVLSNALRSSTLKVVFAVFLLWVGIDMAIRAARRGKGPEPREAPVRVGPTAATGGFMGFASGLLGIGGGIVAVPLLTRFCGLAVRRAIAASAATMMVTAGIGALMKMATLGQHGRSWREAVVVAMLLTPTALLGGYIGGGLTHTVPVRGLRAVLAIAILAAAAKMGGVW